MLNKIEKFVRSWPFLTLFLLIGVFISVAWAANTALLSMTQDTTLGMDSNLYTVDDPAGTPVDRRVTVQELADTIIADIVAGDIPDLSATYLVPGAIDTLAELETLVNGGAYMSDLLASTSEANFKSIVNLEPGTDVQAFDADLTDLADGSLTGTKVAFADTDANWTAANVQAALEELDDVINGGLPNAATGKVDWSQIVNVPAGFADGVDADSAGTPTIITVADTTDATSYIAIFESATGDLAPKTDAAITYDATTGILTLNGITILPSQNPFSIYDETDGTDWWTGIDDTGNSFEWRNSATVGTSVQMELDEDGDLHVTGDIYVTGDDIFATTNTSGAIWVGNGTNYNPVVMSGHASISTSGVVTVDGVSNGAADTALGAAGDMHLNTTDEQLSFHSAADGEISGEAAISLLEHKTWSFDPDAVCDGAVDRLFLMTIGDDAPEGIKIVEWKVSFEADPTTEADLDLKYADAYIGVANATVIDVLDTTAGVSSEDTNANINAGAAIANGKVLYLEFGTAYTETTHQIIFEMWYYAEED